MTHCFKAVLLYMLPHHLLSRIVQWSTRCRHLTLHKSITRWFIHHYNVDMSEALQPNLDAYKVLLRWIMVFRILGDVGSIPLFQFRK